MKKLAFLTLIVAALSLVLAACGSKAVSGSASTTLTVTMTDFAFNPSEVSVPSGVQITLNLTNSGASEHKWVIMKKGIQVTAPFGSKDEGNIFWGTDGLGAGMSQTYTFTAPTEPGEYQVVCSIPGHFEAGMVAKLVVTVP